jgi:hypothetical protein
MTPPTISEHRGSLVLDDGRERHRLTTANAWRVLVAYSPCCSTDWDETRTTGRVHRIDEDRVVWETDAARFVCDAEAAIAIMDGELESSAVHETALTIPELAKSRPPVRGVVEEEEAWFT